MIRSQQDRAFYFQQFRLVNDDLSAIELNADPGNNFQNTVQKTIIFVNIAEIADE
jgi:hypothetical protein